MQLFTVIKGMTPGELRVEGEVDISVERPFDAALTEAAAEGPLVLDLSGVTFMDSTGLRVLVSQAKAANGTAVVIARRSEAVRRLFEVTVPDGVPGLKFRDEESETP
ncbi:MAG TPA: STAS domain-containing protein [Actinomycetota bacterium]|jgi:anti-anti-sigma factor